METRALWRRFPGSSAESWMSGDPVKCRFLGNRGQQIPCCHQFGCVRFTHKCRVWGEICTADAGVIDTQKRERSLGCQSVPWWSREPLGENSMLGEIRNELLLSDIGMTPSSCAKCSISLHRVEGGFHFNWILSCVNIEAYLTHWNPQILSGKTKSGAFVLFLK